MRSVVYSRGALKSLRRMPANVSVLIRSKIEQYALNPRELGNNVSALKGEPGAFRLRVGDWRIVFTIDGEVITIVRIAARGGAYD